MCLLKEAMSSKHMLDIIEHVSFYREQGCRVRLFKVTQECFEKLWKNLDRGYLKRTATYRYGQFQPAISLGPTNGGTLIVAHFNKGA